MVFRNISNPKPVAEYIAQQLIAALDNGKSVLWLVPGGSSIGIAVEVSKLLAGHNLSKLSVSLTDERYGIVGHPDSNWKQLADQGFSLPGAQLFPVITGKDRETTTTEYAATLVRLVENNEVRLGFFGIGPDGHTAGILPNTNAVTESSFAASYDAGNFERVTMTPAAISKLTEAVVYAVGEPKWPVLDRLEADVELTEQPSQALKTVPTLTIFNDYRESK